MQDVVIIGAGPAGLFAAFELISKNNDLKVTLLDKGFLASNRHCPMNEQKIPCVNCNPCNIMAGFGGAGTFSDGKLNFIPKLGKSNLYKYMSISEAEELIDYTETIFNKFGMDSKVYPSNMDEALKIKENVAKCGANLLVIKQKHLGSDNLPKYITDFTEFLRVNGVEILECCETLDYEKERDHYIVHTKLKNKDYDIKTKNIIIAPGRTGAKWVQELADKHNLIYVSQSIEIGVRVEVRKEILDSITSTIYDPSIFIKTKTYDDEIRTFCTNPGGYVTKENYYGYICVNGHALKSKKSNNSNFAFISKVNLTEPVTNTREYGESIAKIANTLGGGKPIVQTLKDLRRGRRSTESRIKKGFIEPTLKDVVAGDLALVMPHRIITNILEGLEVLDKIIPGVNNDETLLYGPEIKFFSNEIETDNFMKIKSEAIYFVGDGAGKAGNIVTAAATGIVAARDILNKGNK
ncbi:MAG TPA: FAD-dependent oxidoreductase [Candidatus Onthocola stercorigallinarum]|nr:FAD-dependent oxidoreductase [Candidatus Onthocola stercorigallinarum]